MSVCWSIFLFVTVLALLTKSGNGAKNGGSFPDTLKQPRSLVTRKILSGRDLSSQTEQSYSFVYQVNHAIDYSSYNFSNAPQGLTYVHMGMLERLPNSSLAAVWQGSQYPGEGLTNQTLYWSISNDLGSTWTPPTNPLPPMTNGLPVWSPVLHVEGNLVYLFYTVSRDACKYNSTNDPILSHGLKKYTPGGDIFLVVSQNSGLSWSAPQMVLSFDVAGGISKMVANPLHIRPEGTWVLPYWHETDVHNTASACSSQAQLHGIPGVLISTNQGQTWTVSQNIGLANGTEATWLIENTVAAAVSVAKSPPVAAVSEATKPKNSVSTASAVTSPNSSPPAASGGSTQTPVLLQFFRTYKNIPIYESRSLDGGVTWTPAKPTGLRQPNSKAVLLALSSGHLLVAYNDDPQLRTPLVLAISDDAGATFRRVATVASHPAGQFHYPTLLVENGMVHMIYSCWYTQAAWTTFLLSSNSTGGPSPVRPTSGMCFYSVPEAALLEAFSANQTVS